MEALHRFTIYKVLLFYLFTRIYNTLCLCYEFQTKMIDIGSMVAATIKQRLRCLRFHGRNTVVLFISLTRRLN